MCGEQKSLKASEAEEDDRASWREEVNDLDPDKLVLLDETVAWLGRPRRYGRCVGGARVYDTAPKKRKGKASLIAAITHQGMNAQACLVLEQRGR